MHTIRKNSLKIVISSIFLIIIHIYFILMNSIVMTKKYNIIDDNQIQSPWEKSMLFVWNK